MARKNTKKRMQQQPERTAPQPQPPSPQLPPQQQQPVPTWTPKRHQEQQQQQQQQLAHEPDLFGDEFFSQPPAAHTAAAVELRWDDPEDVPTIAPDKRRAMFATIAIFSVFAVAVGGFVIYTQLIMPTPVALGASSGMLNVPQAAPYVPEPAPIAAPVPQAEPAPIVAAEPAAVTAPEPATEPAQEPATEPAAEPAPSIAQAAVVAPVLRAPTARVHRAAHPSTAVPDESLSAQAMRMLNSGHPADARRLAQQATQSNPDRAEGWIVLGAANASLGDHEAAKTAYANCTARATGPRVATCRALAR